jgi:uncharacterized protein (DUF2141 family)
MNVGLSTVAVAAFACFSAVSPARAEDCAGEPGAARLRVEVEGVRSDRGIMTATLYPDEPGKFLRAKGELAVWRLPAKSPVTSMCVWLPAPGRYALVVYDDLNSNLKFDHTTFSPLEPYGFSNNPRLYFILPSAHAVSFSAGTVDTTIHINLRYPAGADAGPATLP